MGSYGLIGETSRPRRARRLGRAWKRRCSLWLFSLSLLSLVYLAFFGARLPFDSLHHGHVNERIFANEVEKSKMRHANDYISEDINTLLEGQGSHTSLGKEISVNKSNFRNLGFASDIKNNLSHARADSQLEGSKHSRAKSRKRHVPCEVGFAESVDNLVEPENYLNFTKFSLEYITKEETSNKNFVIEPRFGGHQTLEQREKSFYARNQTIYCGFVQAPEGYRSTGFDLSEKDGEYMANCIVVVSSCIFGNSDFLRRPTSSKVVIVTDRHIF